MSSKRIIPAMTESSEEPARNLGEDGQLSCRNLGSEFPDTKPKYSAEESEISTLRQT
jgi:hypothetical protein